MGRREISDVVGQSVVLANMLNLYTFKHAVSFLLVFSLRILHIANQLLIGLHLMVELLNSLVQISVFLF